MELTPEQREQYKKEYLRKRSLSSKTVKEVGITADELKRAGFKYINCFDAWVR